MAVPKKITLLRDNEEEGEGSMIASLVELENPTIQVEGSSTGDEILIMGSNDKVNWHALLDDPLTADGIYEITLKPLYVRADREDDTGAGTITVTLAGLYRS